MTCAMAAAAISSSASSTFAQLSPQHAHRDILVPDFRGRDDKALEILQAPHRPM